MFYTRFLGRIIMNISNIADLSVNSMILALLAEESRRKFG